MQYVTSRLFTPVQELEVLGPAHMSPPQRISLKKCVGVKSKNSSARRRKPKLKDLAEEVLND